MSMSTKIMAPPISTSTIHMPTLTRVKVELSDPFIYVISNLDDDMVSDINFANTSANPFKRHGSIESSYSFPVQQLMQSLSLSFGNPPVYLDSHKIYNMVDFIKKPF